MKAIEHSNLISTRYLSEIDEALISTLNLCPSFAIGAFMVLHLSGALVSRHPNAIQWVLRETADALVVHGLIFRFICDYIQQKIFHSFILSFTTMHKDNILLLDYLSNPQRSQHHALDNEMHNSITERCFSYILNGRLTHFPGIHHWASESKRRPWLWRWRKPKGAITNSLSESRWRRKEYRGCNKELKPFWALVVGLKYLPYLLNEDTNSEELIALAKMWPYRYPTPVPLFPHHTKKAGKAVKYYLARFDGKERCESEVAVGPPLLSKCIETEIRR